MQRTTLSVSSTAEIMITGTCSVPGVAFSCSRTEMPSSSGMTMSRRTTSLGSSREELERLVAVRGSADLVTVLLEEATEQLPADAVVVGDEDRRGHVARVILASRTAAVNRVHHIAPSASVGRTI